MGKAWKTVGILVLIVIVLGAVLVGVGFMTGADMARIYSIVEDHYLLNATYEWIQTVISQLIPA